MKKLLIVAVGSLLFLVVAPLILIGPTHQFRVFAVSPHPSNEHNCPAQTNTGAASLEAEPPYVGNGHDGFSRNQNLCLPQLAPVPTSLSPLAFIVQGVEPGIRVDSQGTIYIGSIRGVPGGADLWRWNRTADGAPNTDTTNNGTLPFKYEGQPDNCGIFAFNKGGCAVTSLTQPIPA